MSDFDRNVAARGSFADRAVAVDAGLRAYMIRVYNYMAAAVALTGVVAWFTYQRRGRSPTPPGAITGLTAFGQAIFSGPAMIVLLLGTLGLVFFISFRIHKLQFTTALALFMVYAALLGVTLSSIFLTYTGASITRVFFISAASFGALSLWGYTTQRDLSGMGTFLIMGLFGIIIASLVNLFLKSSGLDWMISIIGVGVFAGLTAYDTQRIKEMYNAMDDDGTARPQGRDGRAVALPRLHQPVPDAAAPGRRPPLIRSQLNEPERPGLSPGRFLLAMIRPHDCRLDPPRHARRHPRHHAASTPKPCCTARRRSSSSRRTRPRWRAGCARCSTAAFPMSWPRSAARWRATPMPGPTARGRPTASPSRIRSTSIRRRSAAASAARCSTA